MKRIDSGIFIKAIVLILYAVLVGFGLYHHEPWRDEAHAWVHARDASVTQIVGDMPYEGVPILWYAILLPFAKLGFPYGTMQIIHWALSVFAAYVLLYKTKIPLPVKLLFLSSYFMAYEHAVISRNYMVTVCLLFLIAATYKDKLHKPVLFGLLVGLMNQTNIQSLFWAASFAFAYLIDLLKQPRKTRSQLAGLGIMVLAGLFSSMTVLHASNQKDVANVGVAVKYVSAYVWANSFVPQELLPYDHPLAPFVNVPSVIQMVSVVSILSLLFLLRVKRKLLFLFIAQLSWLFFVNIVIHPGQLRHLGMVPAYMIFMWSVLLNEYRLHDRISIASQSVLSVTLFLIFFLSSFYTYFLYKADYRENFSAGKDMAGYILDHHLEKNVFVTYGSPFTESVRAYLPPAKNYIAEYGSWGYKNVADERYNSLSRAGTVTPEKILEARDAVGDKNALYLMSMEMPYPYASRFEYLYSAAAGSFWENNTEFFWLYRERQ